METKINAGLSLSRNFDKVTLEILDEPISHETNEEFRAKVRQKFQILREEVNLEFQKIQQ